MNIIKINGIMVNADAIDTITISERPDNNAIEVKVITKDQVGYSQWFPMEVIARFAHDAVMEFCRQAKLTTRLKREERDYEKGLEPPFDFDTVRSGELVSRPKTPEMITKIFGDILKSREEKEAEEEQ